MALAIGACSVVLRDVPTSLSAAEIEAELAELFANDRSKFDKLVKDHVKGLGKKKK